MEQRSDKVKESHDYKMSTESGGTYGSGTYGSGTHKDGGDEGGSWGSGGAAVAEAAPETKLAPPKMYRVLLHNDDYTPMDFVVSVLVNLFRMDERGAVQIMLQVHHDNVGLAGVYDFATAETKTERVHQLARQSEFPLRATMEAE